MTPFPGVNAEAAASVTPDPQVTERPPKAFVESPLTATTPSPLHNSASNSTSHLRHAVDDADKLDPQEESLDGAAEDERHMSLDSTGVIATYLAGVKERVQSEIRMYGRPKVYHDGTFWIRPKDPFFAMRAELSSGSPVSPELLYRPRVFLWLPQELAPEVRLCCPNCGKKDWIHSKGV